MEGWQTRKIKQLCEIGRGRVISEVEVRKKPGPYPVYSSQSQNKGEFGRISTFDFDGEYVTWTTDGAYAGTVFYRIGKFNCTNVCGTLKAKDGELSMSFLAYLLSTVAKKHVSYVGNPKLMNNVMAEIELTLPSRKNEQEQIAAVLSCIDRVIELTEVLISKQQRLKAGLMQKLLTKGIDEHGNIRSEATHEFKGSPLGRIPAEWEIYSFEHLIESAVDGPFGSNLKTEHYVAQPGVRVVRLQNIGSGYFDGLDKAYVSGAHALRLKRHEVVGGDLIVASLGDPKHPIARACLYPPHLSAGIVKADCFRLRLKSQMALNAYAMYALNCQAARNDIALHGQGVTRDRINLASLKRVRLRTPSVDEQSRIVAVLQAHDKSLAVEEHICDKVKVLKQGLMQNLLTGKVRVTPLLETQPRTNG